MRQKIVEREYRGAVHTVPEDNNYLPLYILYFIIADFCRCLKKSLSVQLKKLSAMCLIPIQMINQN